MNIRKRLITTSIYDLKSRFQNLLIPIRDWAILHDFKPNHVTLVSCLLCIVYSLLLIIPPITIIGLILLPLLLLVRMGLNALDGMIATHTNNKTARGMVLNEVCDVISDLALFSAFLLFLPIYYELWIVLIILSLLSEFVSLAIYQAIGSRPNFGPFGKSDRAVYLGIVAISLVLFPSTLVLIQIYIVLGLILALLTIWNRLQTYA